jgi:hypothetical protein
MFDTDEVLPQGSHAAPVRLGPGHGLQFHVQPLLIASAAMVE